jgi:nitrate reductase delta subunit
MNPYDAMASLFDYPYPEFEEGSARAIAASSGESRSLLQAFHDGFAPLGISQQQELYIDTFDVCAETSPYIGHHLFGEEIRRSQLMAQLRGRYRESGLEDTIELPDHLANVLRFLAIASAGEERTELICHCLIPALEHMLRAFRPGNPYALLVQALLLAARQEENLVAQERESAWPPYSSSSSPMSR